MWYVGVFTGVHYAGVPDDVVPGVFTGVHYAKVPDDFSTWMYLQVFTMPEYLTMWYVYVFTGVHYAGVPDDMVRGCIYRCSLCRST